MSNVVWWYLSLSVFTFWTGFVQNLWLFFFFFLLFPFPPPNQVEYFRDNSDMSSSKRSYINIFSVILYPTKWHWCYMVKVVIRKYKQQICLFGWESMVVTSPVTRYIAWSARVFFCLGHSNYYLCFALLGHGKTYQSVRRKKKESEKKKHIKM